QPIDLVDDDNLDAGGSDVGEQSLQRRPLQLAAGKPAIVITGSRQDPALVLLAADIGLASIALRLQRIEFLIEPFLGRVARVDGAALVGRLSQQHRGVPSAGRSLRTRVPAGGEPTGSTAAQKTAGPTTRCR